MFLVALGQGKMFDKPVAAIMHLFIYVGFVIINIELLEILADGLLGTHRLFAFMGSFYNFLIASFEILALLVVVACVVFLARRNVLKLKRFMMREITSWPRTDANLILIIEIFLMSAFLTMNASDAILQSRGAEHYIQAGAFPVSSHLVPLLNNLSDGALIFIERFCWWFHIIGILGFVVYVTYSKSWHFRIPITANYSLLEVSVTWTRLPQK
jgi:hypothetical protein